MNKKNKSSIYELFNVLNEGERKKEEILTLLDIQPSTFYKNLQKLKLAGFEINKKDDFYYLEKYKNVLLFDDKEKNAIAYMLNIARRNLPEFKYCSFQNFIKKISNLSNENEYNDIIEKFKLIKKYSLIEELKEKIEELEKSIRAKETLKITLYSNKKLRIIPLGFSESRKKIFLNYKNLVKYKEEKIKLDDIVKIEKYTERDYIQNENEIIFELYGSLAERYLLKQNERILKNKKDSIVIAVNTKDEDALFKRLLRYDISCKILFPKESVNRFNKLIDEAIINIDLYKDNHE